MIYVEPGSIDPPMLSDAQARSLQVSWQTPLRPNGIITLYNLYQNNSLVETVSTRYLEIPLLLPALASPLFVFCFSFKRYPTWPSMLPAYLHSCFTMFCVSNQMSLYQYRLHH